MNSEPLCLVCADSTPESCLDCKCSVCTSCLYGWMAYQTEEHFATGDKYIRCPNGNCDCKYLVQTLLPKLPLQENQQLSDLLLKNYLHEARDVVNCRKGSCKYYGVMPSETCSDELSCDVCGHRWKEKSQMSILERILFVFMHISSAISDVQTAIYHLIYTLECPKCQIPIRKVGGCAHMTCRRCSYEFCWDCKQDYTTHSKNHCLAYKFTTRSLVGFCLFFIGGLIGLYATLWSLWMSAVRLILKLCLLNTVSLVGIFLIYPILRICREEESIFQDKFKSIFYITWISVMSYISFWHLKYLLTNYLEELLWAICVELVLIWIVKGIDFLVQTWLKLVF